MSRTPLPNRRAHEAFHREVWRPVVGYERAYEVSNLGRVRSLDRVVHLVRLGKPVARLRRGIILATPLNKTGYPIVTLCNGEQRVECVHTLVLTAFVGPPAENQECLHYDGVRSNSRIENLSWGTSLQNQDDRARHGTIPRGECHGMAKLRASDVAEIRSSRAKGVDLAWRFNVTPNNISRIRLGKTWKHL